MVPLSVDEDLGDASELPMGDGATFPGLNGSCWINERSAFFDFDMFIIRMRSVDVTTCFAFLSILCDLSTFSMR
jgi:hypothetical protein